MQKRRLLIVIGSLIVIFSLGFGIPLLFLNNQEDQAFISAGSSARQSASEPGLIQTREVVSAPASVSEANCTYPLEYWIERPASWPENVMIGETSYSREEMLAIFKAEETEQAYVLLRGMYTAFLNVLHGADLTSVEEVILDANTWLSLNPPGSPLSEFNLRRGAELASLLEGFNNGVFGPGACPDAPVPSETTSGEQVGVPEVAMLPSVTPTPGTVSQQGGTGESASSPGPTVVVQPVQPPAPTNPPPPPPTNPPPQPTDPPPPPPPTDTPTPLPTNPPPPPPTDTPVPTLLPTSTPAPTNTPVPTQAPTNTPLPTLPLPTNTAVPTLPPPPQDGVCTGTIGSVTLDKLTVPAGASCILNGTTIEGNIDVYAGASLVANSISASGNLSGMSANWIEVLSGSYIGGNLRVEYGGSARIAASSINGNLRFEENGGGLEASGNQIGGNFEVEDNTGGVVITNNYINGNLKCEDNSPPPSGGGNTVGGNLEGQCTGL
jgi:hypothetical protein